MPSARPSFSELNSSILCKSWFSSLINSNFWVFSLSSGLLPSVPCKSLSCIDIPNNVSHFEGRLRAYLARQDIYALHREGSCDHRGTRPLVFGRSWVHVRLMVSAEITWSGRNLQKLASPPRQLQNICFRIVHKGKKDDSVTGNRTPATSALANESDVS